MVLELASLAYYLYGLYYVNDYIYQLRYSLLHYQYQALVRKEVDCRRSAFRLMA